MTDSIKKGNADIHPLFNDRWSPYVFADKPVSRDDLIGVFEAARWAPSSYNEQPWRYIVASKAQPDAYQAILSCLVEGNQAWAKHAPILALGIIVKNLAKTGKENRAALHDLGAASLSIALEATHRGLFVHQMIGIEPEKVRSTFDLSANAEAYTGLAMGYRGNPENAEESFKTRDTTPRSRKEKEEIVFVKRWGKGIDFDQF